MKWLVVCDPALPAEEYGEVLAGVPSQTERAGCPVNYRALYLEATMEQVRPLTAGDERVCKLLPVWERATLSPSELLVLGRRIEIAQEMERRSDDVAAEPSKDNPEAS